MALQEICKSCREMSLSDLHSIHYRPAASVCCSEIVSCCAEMLYSLEQQIFLVLEFHHQKNCILETRHSFQKKFNVTKRLKDDTIKALFEKFQRTGNINGDCSENVERPCAAVTEANVELTQQVIQQQPQFSICHVAAQAGLQCMSTFCIICHSLYQFSYRIQICQPISVVANNKHNISRNAMLQQLDAGKIDVGKILFSNEFYFPLDCFIN